MRTMSWLVSEFWPPHPSDFSRARAKRAGYQQPSVRNCTGLGLDLPDGGSINAILKSPPLTDRFLRWIAVGVAFTVMTIGLIKLLAGILAWPYALATICTSEICTVLRFLAVDHWVFERRRPTWTRLWQYHVSNAVGFCIWWSVANALRAAGVHYLLAATLAIPCTIGLSLLSDFLWIWRKPHPSRNQRGLPINLKCPPR